MSLKNVCEWAKKKGFSPKSRIINITHFDLDGIVSTINLKNYIDEDENFFYLTKTYDNVNQFFTDVLFKNNCTFKKPDFIVCTDISLEEEVVVQCKEKGFNLIILDHHETAYELNKFENCFVDDTNKKAGAEVTLDFIKEMGYKDTKLDKLNKITTTYDLFLFKNEKDRKFTIGSQKVSLAEMLNAIFFKEWEKDIFIKRWFNGWGDGFKTDEINFIKNEYINAQKHIETLETSKLKVDLTEDKVLLFSDKYVNHSSRYYLDDNKKMLMITINHKRKKVSLRIHDDCNINAGKILNVIYEKCDILSNGGGHEKAAGANLISLDNVDELVEKILKLCKHYEG